MKTDQPKPRKQDRVNADAASSATPKTGEWECPECHTRYMKDVGKCGDLQGCSRPNVIPKPTGEWTVKRLWEALNYPIVSDKGLNKAVKEINAALAAEREKVKMANTQCKTIAALMQDAERQLTAEQETSRYWKEQWVERGAQLAAYKQQAESMLATSKRVNDKLREQLADEKGKVNVLSECLIKLRDGTWHPKDDKHHSEDRFINAALESAKVKERK